ncbi:hypothetical protein [Hymenobacter terrestris]|uniref:Outer membrane protein beta-barrel domain-containing protein n=1 Tax=Hymenobacter terrestris TaxID=2748310 RepID=A0ABX2Q5Y2_9BACT|nr:hypothetical protein [Hymenobacter terrestris]NVO85665.1 hypothetical protein [Hymenobacter terrestris]
MNRYAIAGAAALLLTAIITKAQDVPREPNAQYPSRPRGDARFEAQPNARSGDRSGSDPAPLYRSSIALELGWNAPYGFGITYGYNVSPAFDVNAGVGIGVGGKIGVGARYYFRPNRPFTPYLGVNLVRTGRLNNVEVELDSEQVTYSMRPSATAHLRGGIRWQPGRVGLLATIGYASRLGGDPVTYAPGSYPSPSMHDLVQTISPGGGEFSVGIVIGLGR